LANLLNGTPLMCQFIYFYCGDVSHWAMGNLINCWQTPTHRQINMMAFLISFDCVIVYAFGFLLTIYGWNIWNEWSFYFHHIWNILIVLVSMLKSFFFTDKKSKNVKKAIKKFPSVTCRGRRRWQKFVLHLQPRP
jgi:hypothetical protein